LRCPARCQRLAEAGRFVSEMIDRCLAPSTVRTLYGVLQGAMTAAVESDLISRSPCRGIKVTGNHEKNPGSSRSTNSPTWPTLALHHANIALDAARKSEIPSLLALGQNHRSPPSFSGAPATNPDARRFGTNASSPKHSARPTNSTSDKAQHPPSSTPPNSPLQRPATERPTPKRIAPASQHPVSPRRIADPLTDDQHSHAGGGSGREVRQILATRSVRHPRHVQLGGSEAGR
jgi:hypothetical protein